MTALQGEALVWLLLGLSIIGVLGAMYLVVKFAYHKPFVFLITIVFVCAFLFYLFGLNS